MKKHRILQALALLLTVVVLVLIAACGNTNGPDLPYDYTTNGDYTTDETVGVDLGQITWRVEIRGVAGITQFTNLDADLLPVAEVSMPVTTAQGFTVTQTFRGVSLRAMLGFLGVHNVHNVMVSSVDGTNVNLDRDLAMHEDTILAWEQDGSPINTEPPLRLAPGAGTAAQHVRLVNAITVAPAPPLQITTAPAETTDVLEGTTTPAQNTMPTTTTVTTTGPGPDYTTTTTTTTTTTARPPFTFPQNLPTWTTAPIGGGTTAVSPTRPPVATQPTTTTVARSISIIGGNRTVTTATTVIGFSATATPATIAASQIQWRIVVGAGFASLSGAVNGIATGSTANLEIGTTPGAVRLEASIPGATAGAARIVTTVDIIINEPS
ncbi:MAG: molybdopterin-dependent oxidoreductase [Oscillospiraceae bacterium]|nr:molybdopterin-dependent oxidoreductase [Oscillospiraceae bacterium]